MRTLGLDEHAPSVARHWVRPVLEDWQATKHADDTELVASELVTNAIFHAAPPVSIALTELPDGIRVEVTDASPHLLPVASGTGLAEVLELDADWTSMTALDTETMTGRGLVLVETIASSWGTVTSDTTKTVWADIGTPGPPPATGPTPAPTTTTTSSGATVDVELLALPARLVLTSAANLDDVVREFSVAQRNAQALDARIGPLAQQLLSRTSGVREPVRVASRRAIDAGERIVSVTVPTPAAAEPVLREFLDIIEQLSDFCADGALLSLAPTEEVRAFRRWYVEEIASQLAGATPTMCSFPAIAVDDERVQAAARAADRDLPASVAVRGRDRVDDLVLELAQVGDVRSVVDALAAAVADCLGANSASLCLLTDDGRSLELVEAGYPDDVVGHWSTFPVAADLPASEVVRTKTPMFLRTPRERDVRFPVFTRTPVIGSGAIGIVPVGTRGALVTGFPESRQFTADDRELLAALAQAADDALNRLH